MWLLELPNITIKLCGNSSWRKSLFVSKQIISTDKGCKVVFKCKFYICNIFVPLFGCVSFTFHLFTPSHCQCPTHCQLSCLELSFPWRHPNFIVTNNIADWSWIWLSYPTFSTLLPHCRCTLFRLQKCHWKSKFTLTVYFNRPRYFEYSGCKPVLPLWNGLFIQVNLLGLSCLLALAN